MFIVPGAFLNRLKAVIITPKRSEFPAVAFDANPFKFKYREPVDVIVPTVRPVPEPTEVTPELELVPAPIRLLTSAAVIPLAKDGEDPFVVIAGKGPS